MPNCDPILSNNSFLESLKVINKIRFTNREVEVIVCVVFMRGTTRIASILSIAPRTVETHLANIMRKIECHSREEINDFIEKGGKFLLARRYYEHLLFHEEFRKRLKQIFKLAGKPASHCRIIYEKKHVGEHSFIEYLEKYLIAAGSKVRLEPKGTNNLLFQLNEAVAPPTEGLIVYVVSKGFLKDFKNHKQVELEDFLLSQETKKKLNNIVFLLFNPEDTTEGPRKLKEKECIHYVGPNNCTFMILEALRRLLPNCNIDPIITQFKNDCKKIYTSYAPTSPQLPPQVNEPLLVEKLHFRLFKSFHRMRRWMFVTGIVSACGVAVLVREERRWVADNNPGTTGIRSDLLIPTESAFLARHKLVKEIHLKLKKRSGIQTVVLVGIGGSGKTTVARQYMRSQKLPVIWEVNAETRDSIQKSFKDLAYRLAKSEQQKNEIDFIQRIQGPPEEKERQLLAFVKKCLRQCNNWIITYDNADMRISDIKNYFPIDPEVWGEGKVIMTTRDSNIKNTSYIKADNVILVGELTEMEAKTLFSKILYACDAKDLPPSQKNNIQDFLKNIPFFPLDISIAAYYIKNENTDFDTYLKRIKEYSKDFENIQKTLVSEVSDYKKTRYGIIASSLEKLININPDYKQLLSFMSMISNEKIPIKIFEFFSLPFSIEGFLRDVRRYSLLHVAENVKEGNKQNFVSLHRTTQKLGVKYLTNLTSEEERTTYLSNTITALGQYYKTVVKSDFELAFILLSHLKKYEENLSPTSLEKEPLEPALLFMLGEIHYLFKRDFLIAEQYLKQAYEGYKNNKANLDLSQYVTLLMNLGEIHVELSNLDSALSYASQSIEGAKNLSNNLMFMVRNLKTMGYGYSLQNNFLKAHSLFDQALSILEKEDGENPAILKMKSEIYGIYGQCYGKIFFNNKQAVNAVDLVKKGIDLLKDKCPLVPTKINRHSQDIALNLIKNLIRLGDVYCRLGLYEQAEKEGVGPAISIINNYLGEYSNSLLKARIAAGQAVLFLNNNKPNEAEDCLTEALNVFEASFPRAETVRITRIKRALARIKAGNTNGFIHDFKKVIKDKNAPRTNELKFLYAIGFYHLALHELNNNNSKEAVENLENFFSEINSLKDNFRELGIKDNENVYSLALQKIGATTTITTNSTLSILALHKELENAQQILDYIEERNKTAYNL